MLKAKTIVFAGFFSIMIINPVSAAIIYWNILNPESDSSISAALVTYSTLQDMLNDDNRMEVVTPGGFGRNIVGSASDGTTYWNVFNIEGESESTGLSRLTIRRIE
ncbi:MAG: hypothetical protein JKX81_16555 [Arenicella sp.]|nr:hypothetical protein [Arenicella sp.]